MAATPSPTPDVLETFVKVAAGKAKLYRDVRGKESPEYRFLIDFTDRMCEELYGDDKPADELFRRIFTP